MRLRIKDIKHTGNHGKFGKSKIGDKYDERRGKIFEFDPKEEEMNLGNSLHLKLENYEYPVLYTTPFVDSYFGGDDYIIETKNSFYICEVIE